ncbi:MAG TPA: hypothetical protein VEC19_01035 [Usitatibacter sp.]|nr:hypothetical protein [Usitatibacter sp.]
MRSELLPLPEALPVALPEPDALPSEELLYVPAVPDAPAFPLIELPCVPMLPELEVEVSLAEDEPLLRPPEVAPLLPLAVAPPLPVSDAVAAPAVLGLVGAV